jgi:hypothetical protein
VLKRTKKKTVTKGGGDKFSGRTSRLDKRKDAAAEVAKKKTLRAKKLAKKQSTLKSMDDVYSIISYLWPQHTINRGDYRIKLIAKALTGKDFNELTTHIVAQLHMANKAVIDVGGERTLAREYSLNTESISESDAADRRQFNSKVDDLFYSTSSAGFGGIHKEWIRREFTNPIQAPVICDVAPEPWRKIIIRDEGGPSEITITIPTIEICQYIARTISAATSKLGRISLPWLTLVSIISGTCYASVFLQQLNILSATTLPTIGLRVKGVVEMIVGCILLRASDPGLFDRSFPTTPTGASYILDTVAASLVVPFTVEGPPVVDYEENRNRRYPLSCALIIILIASLSPDSQKKVEEWAPLELPVTTIVAELITTTPIYDGDDIPPSTTLIELLNKFFDRWTTDEIGGILAIEDQGTQPLELPEDLELPGDLELPEDLDTQPFDA